MYVQKKNQLVISNQFKYLHLWWYGGAQVPMKVAACICGKVPSMLKGTWYILLNLCSILNKIWLYKICRFMHSFFYLHLTQLPNFLELWNKVLLWQNGSDSFKIQHCIFLLWRMPCALGFFAHLWTGRFLYRVSPFYLLNSLASAVVAVAMIPFHFFLAVEKHQYVSMVYNSQC